MNRLSDHELDQLLIDAARADKRLRPMSRDYELMQPRIVRLLMEHRTLRDQHAESQFMQQIEGAN